MRKDLFEKTMNLSGSQFDAFGLPSLTSRMTSDSYNVQNFSRDGRDATANCVSPIPGVGRLLSL